MDHRLPEIIAKRSQQKNFGGSLIVAKAEEPGVKHARGVEYDRAASGNQLLQIAEAFVEDLSAAAIDDHEPAVTAPLSRMLGDSVSRKIEIVVRCA
jgi:hypothetical protein